MLSYAAIHWQCQSVDFSLTQPSIMMTTNISCSVCVLLCTVCVVASAKIKGTIKKTNIRLPTEVELSEYINGAHFVNTESLTLDRLLDGATLPRLTVTNLKSIQTLNITNISLEQVPVFKNTLIQSIYITANKLKTIPTDAFAGPRPQRLNLMNNEIDTIADRSINARVTMLTLRCNKLRHFSPAWFQDPSIIRILNLAGNEIESIQDQAFTPLTGLHVLYLSNNRIARIGSAAFNSRINHLHLQFNDIGQITSDTFATRHMPMTFLLLHHNQLSFLPEALLVKLKPTRLTLDGNPWQCQCLREIERWLRELNITRHYLTARREEPVCVVPSSFNSACVPVVDTELQQTYAERLSPVEGCLATPCSGPCRDYGIDITFA